MKGLEIFKQLHQFDIYETLNCFFHVLTKHLPSVFAYVINPSEVTLLETVGLLKKEWPFWRKYVTVDMGFEVSHILNLFIVSPTTSCSLYRNLSSFSSIYWSIYAVSTSRPPCPTMTEPLNCKSPNVSLYKSCHGQDVSSRQPKSKN